MEHLPGNPVSIIGALRGNERISKVAEFGLQLLKVGGIKICIKYKLFDEMVLWANDRKLAACLLWPPESFCVSARPLVLIKKLIKSFSI